MAISDFFIDHDRSRPLFELTRWTIYATLAATTLFGPLANSPRFGRWLLPVLALGGSTLFFVTSNLATWGEGLLYPMTFSGLVDCYIEAIPYFRNTIAADLLGTAIFSSAWHRSSNVPRCDGGGPGWPRSRPTFTRPIHHAPLETLDPTRGQAAGECSFAG